MLSTNNVHIKQIMYSVSRVSLQKIRKKVFYNNKFFIMPKGYGSKIIWQDQKITKILSIIV